MADKEVLYRIEFEGAKEQLKVLADIREELDKIAVEQIRSDKSDKVRQEELKLSAKLQQDNYRKTQQAIKDEANAQKAVAGSLADLRIKARQYTKELENIKLGTKEFVLQADKVEAVNRAIRKADTSAGNFKSNIGNYAGSIGDAFQGIGVNVGGLTSSLGAASMATGPLGVGLVALTAGAQLFGTAISATDTLADKFAITMEQAKAASQVFFKALAEGDFSNFLTNIREAIKEGERYAKTIDYLEDAQRGASVSEAAYRLQIAKLKIEMRDTSKSNDERIAAIKKIVEIETQIGAERLRLADKEVENELRNKSVLNNINQDKLKNLIQNFAAYEKQFGFVEKLQDAQSRLTKATFESRGFASVNPEVARLTKTVEGLQKATAGYSEEVIAFGKVAGPEREKIATALIKKYEAEAYATEETTRAQVSYGALTAEAFKEVETAAATSAKTLSKYDEGLVKIREEAIKLNDELMKIAATLSGGVLRNTAISMAGGQFKGATTFGGVKLPDELKPTERKGAGKVNLGEDEAAGFDYNATADAASQFVNIWADAYAAKDKALQEMLDKGQITEKQYQKESEKLQKRAANLQRASVIAQLTGDIAKTLSALGVGAANTAKVGFPLNIPLMIAFAAQAIGIISNMRSIKFAEGGLIAGGKPHSQGGTKYVGDDGSAFEAERGEYIAVVNKHDSKRLGELSNLNSRHGKSFYGQPQSAYFAQGGMFAPNQNIGAGSQAAMIRDMIKQIGSIPVEVSLDEIQRKTNTKRKVNVIGSL